MQRRNVLAGLAAALTAGCTKIGQTDAFNDLVKAADKLHRGAHRVLGGRRPMAREFAKADISPFFRGNGSLDVDSDQYRASAANQFADWRLAVTGLVNTPLSLSLDELHHLSLQEACL